MLETHNSFNFFMQTLNVDEVCQVRVNRRNFGFIQTWGNNTKVNVPNKREMWLPCFEQISPLNGMKMPWYSACSLLLLFRTNGKKGNLNENDFRHCFGRFFRKWHSERHLITAMFRVPSQHFERYPTIFYGHGSTYVLNLSSKLR